MGTNEAEKLRRWFSLRRGGFRRSHWMEWKSLIASPFSTLDLKPLACALFFFDVGLPNIECTTPRSSIVLMADAVYTYSGHFHQSHNLQIEKFCFSLQWIYRCSTI